MCVRVAWRVLCELGLKTHVVSSQPQRNVKIRSDAHKGLLLLLYDCVHFPNVLFVKGIRMQWPICTQIVYSPWVFSSTVIYGVILVANFPFVLSLHISLPLSPADWSICRLDENEARIQDFGHVRERTPLINSPDAKNKSLDSYSESCLWKILAFQWKFYDFNSPGPPGLSLRSPLHMRNVDARIKPLVRNKTTKQE